MRRTFICFLIFVVGICVVAGCKQEPTRPPAPPGPLRLYVTYDHFEQKNDQFIPTLKIILTSSKRPETNLMISYELFHVTEDFKDILMTREEIFNQLLNVAPPLELHFSYSTIPLDPGQYKMEWYVNANQENWVDKTFIYFAVSDSGVEEGMHLKRSVEGRYRIDQLFPNFKKR